MSDILHIGWVREDRAHDELVKTLAAKVARAHHDWIDDSLDSMWSWKGPANEDEPKLSGRIKVPGPGGKPLRLHGRIAGESLLPEASMHRTVLTAFAHRDPRPSIVIIAHDGDGDSKQRRMGFMQVRDRLEWAFDVVLAMPEPEGEAWFICGFEPRDADERARLAALTRELSFDPTKQPERTTSRPNDAASDAKRILAKLTNRDALREAPCLDHSIDELMRRGRAVGLAEFIEDLSARLPHHFVAR